MGFSSEQAVKLAAVLKWRASESFLPSALDQGATACGPKEKFLTTHTLHALRSGAKGLGFQKTPSVTLRRGDRASACAPVASRTQCFIP